MSVSTQFANSVASQNYEKAVRSIFRIAYLKEKDLNSAKEHFDFLLQSVSVEQLLESLPNDYQKKVNKLVNEFDIEVVEDNPVENGLEDKFEAMEDFINCVALGHANGLFISGEGGTGKTWTVKQCLAELGLREDIDYITIQGFSTAVGLYNTLYKHSDKLVVFDDCDSIFKDPNGLNILKAVLDTYPQRVVSYASAKGAGAEVDKFRFTGRIIFISNINPNTARNASFRAVMTRVLSIIVGGTKEEVRDRIISLVPIIGDKLSEQQHTELIEFISKNYNRVNELSIRYLVHLVGLMMYKPHDWQRLAWHAN